MSHARVTQLSDRGAIRVAGEGALKFLQGLVTNDLETLEPGEAVHAALLSPQGKILFDFVAARSTDGFVLECALDKVAELIKRLTFYRLRAPVEIAEASVDYRFLALWGPGHCSSGETIGTVSFEDPRLPELGRRILAEARFARDIASATNATAVAEAAYHAHRISLCVPEGGKDFDFGDAYPHEANLDLLKGVSFSKGCYVGQEIVARMQHKSVIRKRVVRVTGEMALPLDQPDVTAGGVAIGRLGSVSGADGLALLRIDRALEFLRKGEVLTAGGVKLTLAPPQWMPLPESAAIEGA